MVATVELSVVQEAVKLKILRSTRESERCKSVSSGIGCAFRSYRKRLSYGLNNCSGKLFYTIEKGDETNVHALLINFKGV